MRSGSEAAEMQENPFAGYYGGADTTALFPVLAKEYYDHGDDPEFFREIWPNMKRSLAWIA